MEDEILKNIWNELSSKGKTSSNFDAWKTNMYGSDEVQANVHGYLKDNGYTDSELSDWKTNVLQAKTSDSASADPTVESEKNTDSQSGSGSSEQQEEVSVFKRLGHLGDQFFKYATPMNAMSSIAANLIQSGLSIRLRRGSRRRAHAVSRLPPG